MGTALVATMVRPLRRRLDCGPRIDPQNVRILHAGTDHGATSRPEVAKNQNVMAPGTSNEYTFRQVADTLWLTQVRNLTTTIENPSTVRYVRAR